MLDKDDYSKCIESHKLAAILMALPAGTVVTVNQVGNLAAMDGPGSSAGFVGYIDFASEVYETT